ncbi:MAG: anti-FecI sigma factor, FecR [Mucilaginibacter sp.]|nr:anti-FecI sigma factor, FecR [Mucilaginibacter sp.]
MANARLKDLFDRSIAKKLSLPESEELMDLIAAEENEEQVKELFKTSWDNFSATIPAFSNKKSEEILQRVLRRTQPAKTRSLWPKIIAAASILLVLSAGGYFILNKGISPSNSEEAAINIKPGKNRAILTLVNGKQIILTAAGNGKIAVQGNININKIADGEVAYNGAVAGNETPMFNTISTPRGGQYHITLADGTNVWLNASSSLKFPTTFNGKDRLVELSGEGYFEVAHNKAMPFRVKTPGQIVEVLGTHFNINSYQDESTTKTTLLEGSVKITHDNIEKLLVPGEQASVNAGLFDIVKKNTDEAVAWKNGYFRFVNTPLPIILRQFERWYDITIVYDKSLNDQYFSGKITRNADLSRVLKILEQGGVSFELKGRQLTVLSTNK